MTDHETFMRAALEEARQAVAEGSDAEIRHLRGSERCRGKARRSRERT